MLLPDVLVAPEPRLYATVEGGETGAGNPGLDITVCAETSPPQSQRALRAVPIHANSELYHMLRPMSKQTFTRVMFTHRIRTAVCTRRSLQADTIPQFLYFDRLPELHFIGTSLDLFPFGLSRLPFSVVSGVGLNLPEKSKTCLGTALRYKSQVARTYDSLFDPHLDPVHKEEYDERIKPEYSFSIARSLCHQL